MSRVLDDLCVKALLLTHRQRIDASTSDAWIRRALSPDAPPLHMLLKARRLCFFLRFPNSAPTLRHPSQHSVDGNTSQ